MQPSETSNINQAMTNPLNEIETFPSSEAIALSSEQPGIQAAEAKTSISVPTTMSIEENPMKTSISILISLSALTLSLVSVPVLAQEIANRHFSTGSIVEITPFNLVTSSYQGHFVDQGISSNAAFITEVKRGKITAEDLVEAAIDRGRLRSGTLNDEAYLNSVEAHLDSLEED